MNNQFPSAGYFDHSGRRDLLSGGVRLIPISTASGTFKVWTRRVGNNPRIKVLLLHGGPGGSSDFTAVFDEIFASVSALHELAHEFGRVDDGALGHDDRFDHGRVGPELLQKCAHARDDHLWHALWSSDPPQQLEPTAHGLHTRTHALERQCFPRRKLSNCTSG